MFEQYKIWFILAVLIHEAVCIWYGHRTRGTFGPINWRITVPMMVFQVGAPALTGFFDSWGFAQVSLAFFGIYFVVCSLIYKKELFETKTQTVVINTFFYLTILWLGGWFGGVL